MKKKIIMATLAVTILGSSLWGTTSVNAQNRVASQELVTKIAQKFKLNESEVKAVFDEAHQQRAAQMQKTFEEKLTQSVTAGKITEAQKLAIIAKFKELHAQREANKGSMQNMTPEQRKAAKEKQKADLDTWAKANGIDLQNLPRFLGHKGFGKGMR